MRPGHQTIQGRENAPEPEMDPPAPTFIFASGQGGSIFLFFGSEPTRNIPILYALPQVEQAVGRDQPSSPVA